MAHPFVDGHYFEEGLLSARQAQRSARIAVWEALSPEDRVGYKASALEAELLANGFERQEELITRRDIYKELLARPHPEFRGYRPTHAEVFDKTLGPDNWTLVDTGAPSINRKHESDDQQAGDDEARHLDRFCAVYTRDREVAREHPEWLTAPEIIEQIEAALPTT